MRIPLMRNGKVAITWSTNLMALAWVCQSLTLRARIRVASGVAV